MKTVGVIGTGTMGSGLIQLFAQKGYTVVMRARRQSSIDKCKEKVVASFNKLVAKGKLTEEEAKAALARISDSTDLSIMKDADFVVEATTEDITVKKELMKELNAICRPDVIFASNTSSLSITEIAAASGRADKVIGMHFFNPVGVMKLVEVIKGFTTSEETNQFAIKLAKDLGKEPVEVAEAPAFICNRLLIPMINDGINILAEGSATKEDIDAAMKLGANHPMGPLELGDFIGLDIVLAIMDVLYYEFGDTKYRACPLLRKMVRAGKLGRKSGEGFYKYN